MLHHELIEVRFVFKDAEIVVRMVKYSMRNLKVL